MSIFPEDMIKKNDFSTESIAAKLTYFSEQIHLIHWQTNNNSKHVALGNLYEFIDGKKDGIIEMIMGYSGKKIKNFTIPQVSSGTTAEAVISEIIEYTYNLKEWADENHYCQVANDAIEISGKAAVTKYLLTQE